MRRLTGQATAKNSVIYFADLVSKSIVNLEDPLYADLVDTAAIRLPRPGRRVAEPLPRLAHDPQLRVHRGRGRLAPERRSEHPAPGRRDGPEEPEPLPLRRRLQRHPGDLQPQAARDHPRIRGDPGPGDVSRRSRPERRPRHRREAHHPSRPTRRPPARDIEVTAHIGGTLREPRSSRWPRASGRRSRRATSFLSWCSGARSTAAW